MMKSPGATSETPESGKLDRSLVAKYDVSGPRYTSYPTALQFSDNFGADDYRRLSGDGRNTIAPLSLYVHIPFCENICYYCACNKVVTRQKEKARSYLDHLEKEIVLRSALVGRTRPVTQMHWGGGTPTYLDATELTELMYNIAAHFKLIDTPDREYSIEIDPRTVNDETLALLKGLGFNRLSFGVQDFDPAVQHAINRVQSFEQTKALIDTARDLNFSSISIDLIYGLPLQSPASLRRTLQQIVALAPHRISFYNYAHMPQQVPSQRSIDRMELPAPDEKLAMLELANEMLGAAGYRNIGMDHFVRADDTLARAQREGTLQRNFQGYSTKMATDLIGLGVSAISSFQRGYSQNVKALSDYYARLDDNGLPIGKGLQLTTDDVIRRFVIMELICNLHLDIAALEKQFDIVFAQYFAAEREKLAALEKDGLIAMTPAAIIVTPAGRFLLRNICMAFDAYLQTSLRNYSRAI